MNPKKKIHETHIHKPDAERNPDPITGTPGAHAVGTGMGAASAGAAGAALGAVAGPVGAIVGGVVGAVAGGLTGKGVAEYVKPTEEDEYWREYWRQTHTRCPYVEEGVTFDAYKPAYEFGWQAHSRLGERRFDDVEGDLRQDWEKSPHAKSLEWERARPAMRDAYDRIAEGKAARLLADRKPIDVKRRTTGGNESMPTV